MVDYLRNGQRPDGPTAQPAVPRPTSDVGTGSSTRGSPVADSAGQPGTPQSMLPALTLPKGGGAIHGIGEKFQVSAATGTASLGIPLPASPGRGGFGPSIDLSYDSGNGNGPFGLGFNLSVPSITRKTDKGLPRYIDAAESDEFILSGVEDLVPTRDAATGELVELDRGEYLARRYRPRVEGSFARIERWIHRVSGEAHWRVTTADNVTHVYGTTPASRIVDPKDPRRIFSWLLEQSEDDKGNIVRYEYKAEDAVGIERDRLSEHSRFDGATFLATAQRYLKRVLYCNAAPFVAGDFLLELVFDYGDHAAQPTPAEALPWPVRPDPISSYRAGFEVRTYRLCRRVLMFHRFSADRAPLLVKSTDFEHEAGPAFTYLVGVTQAGYLFEAGAWQRQTLPTLRLDYSRAVLNDELQVLPAESLEGLQGGIDGLRKQWVDLDGEGIPGVLIDGARAWHYKSNRGDAKLAPPRALSSLPAPAELAAGVQQLADIDGDGQLELISYEPPLAGYFARTSGGGFENLRAFANLPNLDFRDPNLRFVDLDGDGHPDLLISDDHVFIWYRSKAKDGFEPATRVALPHDDAQGPAVVFADSEQSIQLADMSGDGLVDIVRIRRAEVSYWPNLGYGRFGKKITLENCPFFGRPEAFDARRIRFADVDGSGTSDVFYLGANGTTLYRNESGNRLAAPELIRSLPPVDSVTQLGIVDLLGQGTACLVWSSPLPSSQARPVLFIDLMAGIKPHLLRSVVNNLGAETRITYAASTQFYLADKAAGTPWLTRLPFPVQVVERIERFDAISKSQLVSQYTYHHGFFDGVEREFRGFARVEQRDAEEFTLNEETELHQAPVRTVTWHHTGAWLEKERLERELQKEYFQQGPAQLLLRDTFVLPDDLTPQPMTTADEREATRALRGRMLRQEVYAEDGTDKASIPYVVTEQCFAVRRLQSSTGALHGVFFAHARESMTAHTERSPEDPRVAHDLVLDVDDFGRVTRQASIVYGRAIGQPEQRQSYVTLGEADFVHQHAAGDVYRIGTQVESRSYEVTGLTLPAAGQGLIDVTSLRAALDALAPGRDLDFDQAPTSGVERRLLDREQRTFYTDDAVSEAAFGLVGLRALPYRTYQLALTAGNV
ncbi:MAG TPA: SpvB/TcaC N-terminal domain-containing protein, partial [Polyangiaceae bacterium]|nr:SpvB/TcaC N-terminal domain-containing protein [Polyangiaceae bacterium]